MSDTKKPLIIWTDPPANRQRRMRHAAHVEALHERPGEWALLQRNPKRDPLDNIASSLRRRGSGYERLAYPYSVEATVRLTEGGDYGLWARLVEATP